MRTVLHLHIIALIWCISLIPTATTPTVVAAAKGAVLSAGTAHACAIVAGNIYCWGDNEKGQLGNNDNPNDADSAVRVLKETDGQPLTGVTAVTSGFRHSCAVAQGTAYCWGDNTTNQLGNKNYAQANRAVPVLTSSDAPLTGVSLIEAGTYHTCAIVSGKIYCWGLNGSGQLGNNNMPTASNHATLAEYDASDVAISGASAISSGANSTCAIIKGIAHCWGSNVAGQLGNNDTGTNRSGAVPVKTVLNLPLNSASQLSLFSSHACAIVKGAVYCWGSNNAGQLGDTTTVDKGYAVKALFADGSALTGASAVTTGSSHTCAIIKKAAYCWGSSFYGAIGNNTDNTDPTSEFYGAVAVLTPTLAPLVGATTITSGEDFSCAVANKTIYCWGKNSQGQLGNQDTGNLTKVAIRPMYAQPDLLSGIQAISAGMGHTCAIRKSAVWCWGNNNSGQLGDNTTIDRDGAVITITTSGAPLASVTALGTGRSHTCAVSKGIIYCWGTNGNGQLGNNSVVQSETPVAVQISGGALLTGATRVAAGTGHSCAIAKGQVYCWGNNGSGQLGNNTTDPSLFAVPVMLPGGLLPLKGATAVAAGANHSCALVKGIVYCWGQNDQGQLGIKSFGAASVATVAQLDNSTALTKVTNISAGTSHTCAVSNAQAYCWGDNEYGQLGNNDASHIDRNGAVLVQSAGGGDFTSISNISAGGTHTCANTKNKQLFCWGHNDQGQLGNNKSTGDSDGAVMVQRDDTSVFDTMVSFESGANHTCAIQATQVYCWGDNFSGQVGNKDILTFPDGATPAYFFHTYLTGVQ